MFCPKCKSDKIAELRPTTLNNQITNEIVHIWSPKDSEQKPIPIFNFECMDCHARFSVDSK